MDSMDRLLPTTGIGSLPHLTIEDALSYSNKFDIPFLPELAILDGTILEAKTNSCLEEFLKSSKSTLKKVQYPSAEVLEVEIQDYDNCITFIDAPIIKDIESLTPIITGRGLHCCGNFSIENIIKLSPTHFSFDAGLIDDPYSFVDTLVSNSITPVVGIIATHTQSNSRVENFKIWKKVLRDYVQNCWISPACGLALKSEKECDHILQDLLAIRLEILQSH